MRVVGLLLISALMILPNAVAQQLATSFRATLATAVGIGVGVSVIGITTSFYAGTPSGSTIVVLAVALFAAVASGTSLIGWLARRRHPVVEHHTDHEHSPDCGHPVVEHGGHVDYLHDGQRHAVHGGHYHEH
jgi:zinc transport system permease protein